MAGCIQPDPNLESPIGSYPKITVDFVDNVTKVYVKALTDIRYSNMTLKAFHGNVTYNKIADNDTYIMKMTVAQAEFTFNVTATDNNDKKNIKVYTFEGNFTVRPPSEPNVLLRISIYNQKGSTTVYKVQKSDLPWSTLGNRIK